MLGALAIVGYFGLRILILGRLTMPTDADFEAIAKSGQPIVQAMEDYRTDHGLLPLAISDLVPRYLPQVPEPGWWLEEWSLVHSAGLPRSDVRYTFGEKAGWTVAGDGINYHPLNMPGPILTRPALTGEALFQAQRDEYEKRINHHPQTEEYRDKDVVRELYQDKIDFLGLAGRPDLLGQECERDLKIYPHWWLPQMALAESEPLDTNIENGFVTWVQRHGTFFNYWYLARYYRDHGRTAAALAALDQAGELLFVEYPSDAYSTGDFFASDAARYTYERGDYELTLKLCRHCQLALGQYDEELLQYVAASELRLGKFDAAITDAQSVVAVASERQMSDDVDPHNLLKLLDAAKAHDTNFFYQTRDTEGFQWRLFMRPRP